MADAWTDIYPHPCWWLSQRSQRVQAERDDARTIDSRHHEQVMASLESRRRFRTSQVEPIIEALDLASMKVGQTAVGIVRRGQFAGWKERFKAEFGEELTDQEIAQALPKVDVHLPNMDEFFVKYTPKAFRITDEQTRDAVLLAFMVSYLMDASSETKRKLIGEAHVALERYVSHIESPSASLLRPSASKTEELTA